MITRFALSLVFGLDVQLCSGSPKYFEPILHFLRTNNLEVPPGLSQLSLKDEAEFYGIQKIVDHIDHQEKEKLAKSELPQISK